MEAWIKDAIKYVKENKTWSDAEEAVALERINELRCDLSTASDEIYCSIHDLMEEYCDNEGLPEGWWQEITDEEEIFWALED